MAKKNLKEKIRAVIQYVIADQEQLVAGLSDTQRKETGSLKRWSFKDVIVHSTFWWDILNQRLEAAVSVKKPPDIPDDLDPLNDAVLKKHQHDSWQQVLAENKRVKDTSLSWLEKLSAEELQDKDKFKWLRGRAVFNRFIGVCWHDEWHFASYLAERGKMGQAAKLHEAFIDQLQDIPEWNSTGIYNLACFYSVFNMKEQAIKTLQKALKLRPDMIEWSKEDANFANIRDEAGYKKL